MRTLPALRLIQAFEAAARLSSFAAAANEIGVTPSAISHAVRTLEREVGVSLFHRITRGIVLTDAGARYALRLSQAFSTMEAATRDIDRTVKADILTVHSSPSFATQWLMPKLSRFSMLNPEIDVRLNASLDPVDLSAGEADIDIRYGAIRPAPNIHVAPFPEETFVVACAPHLAQGDDPIKVPADVARQPLIQSEVNLYRWRDWFDDHKLDHMEVPRGLRFDRAFMAIAAAVDGLGMALESRLMLQRELDAGVLMLPFGEGGRRLVCHRMLCLKSREHIPKIHAFRIWLMDGLKQSIL